MAIAKVKNDVSFINKDTMEVECTLNECRLKFKPSYVDGICSPNWSAGFKIDQEEIVVDPNHIDTYHFIEVFHECTECGRRYQKKAERRESVSNYHSAICGHPQEGMIQEAIKQKRFKSKGDTVKMGTPKTKGQQHG